MGNDISAKDLLKLLKKKRFMEISQRGSHVKIRKQTKTERVTIIIPNHKSIKPGTLNAILKRAKITHQEFK